MNAPWKSPPNSVPEKATCRCRALLPSLETESSLCCRIHPDETVFDKSRHRVFVPAETPLHPPAATSFHLR